MIGALLRIPWQAIRARIHREVVEAGFTDVRPRDLAILQYPGPDGMRPSELAARADLSKQAAKPLIDHLIDCGYLESAPDPTDHRALRLSTTPRGGGLLDAIRKIIEGIEADLAAELGSRHYQQLKSSLAELGRAATR